MNQSIVLLALCVSTALALPFPDPIRSTIPSRPIGLVRAAEDSVKIAPTQPPAPEPDPSDEFDPSMTRPDVDLNQIARLVVYPEVARKEGIQGKVQVHVLIDEKGQPVKYRVEHSDDEILTKAAVEAVMLATFTPAMKDGKPIRAWVMIPVSFRLEE